MSRDVQWAAPMLPSAALYTPLPGPAPMPWTPWSARFAPYPQYFSPAPLLLQQRRRPSAGYGAGATSAAPGMVPEYQHFYVPRGIRASAAASESSLEPPPPYSPAPYDDGHRDDARNERGVAQENGDDAMAHAPFDYLALQRQALTRGSEDDECGDGLPLAIAGALEWGRVDVEAQANEAAQLDHTLTLTNTSDTATLTLLSLSCVPEQLVTWDPHAVPLVLPPRSSKALRLTLRRRKPSAAGDSPGDRMCFVCLLFAPQRGPLRMRMRRARVKFVRDGEEQLKLDPRAPPFVPQRNLDAVRAPIEPASLLRVSDAQREMLYPQVPCWLLAHLRTQRPRGTCITELLQKCTLSPPEKDTLDRFLGNCQPQDDRAAQEWLLALGPVQTQAQAADDDDDARLRFALLLNVEQRQQRRDVAAYHLPLVKLMDVRSSADPADPTSRMYVGTLKVPGMKENRPMLSLYDMVYLRRLGADGQTHTLAAIVRGTMPEAVQLLLPPPVGFQYTTADDDQWVAIFNPVTINFNILHRALCADIPTHFLWPTTEDRRTMSVAKPDTVARWRNSKLNAEQQHAVVNIVHRVKQAVEGVPPYIVFGPPGTGKTNTMIEAMLQARKAKNNIRILAVAPSNTAADELALRLIDAGVKNTVMRRLNWFQRSVPSVPARLLPYCFQNAKTGSFDMPDIDKLRQYKVIVATCIAIGAMLDVTDVDPADTFDLIVLDEAAQATEPEARLPLLLARANTTVVLCGDPKQLGPVIMSPIAALMGLDVPLQERLMARACYTVGPHQALIMHLRNNYRSHAALVRLWSSMFYNSALQPCAHPASVRSLIGWSALPAGKEFPLLFVGVQGECEQMEDDASLCNVAEALEVVRRVQQLLADTTLDVKPQDFGVLAPYRKQVLVLRNALRAQQLGQIDVGTVDDYQGKEKRIIIISTVVSPRLTRASAMLPVAAVEQRTGIDAASFLSNPKRFNVAVSRAQALLVVIGHPLALRDDPYWSVVLNACVTAGAYTGCPLTAADDEAQRQSQVRRRSNNAEEELGLLASEVIQRIWQSEHGSLQVQTNQATSNRIDF